MIRTVEPQFDERRFGFGSLIDALKACQREGVLRLERDRQGIVRVWPAGPAARPAADAGAEDQAPASSGGALVADPPPGIVEPVAAVAHHHVEELSDVMDLPFSGSDEAGDRNLDAAESAPDGSVMAAPEEGSAAPAQNQGRRRARAAGPRPPRKNPAPAGSRRKASAPRAARAKKPAAGGDV
jgi:hypothetical protein